MGIDVIRAILSIVFQNENRRVLPKLALADRLHKQAQGEVVFRHHCRGRQPARPGARGVIVGQADDLEPRHLTAFFEALQLAR